MARIKLAQISFFNGVPSTIRGIGPCIRAAQADMFYDTELGLIGFRRIGAMRDMEVQYFSNVGVSMVFDETAKAERKTGT